MVVVMWHCLYQAIKRTPLAGRTSLAFGLVLVTGLHDLSGTVLGISLVDFHLSAFGTIGFLLMQSELLSKRLAMAQAQAEHLTQNLQAEVESQTLSLKSKTEEALRARESAEVATKEALRLKARAETARLEAEDLREAAESHAEELEELDREKTAFFQNMSHELRTPLTLILDLWRMR